MLSLSRQNSKSIICTIFGCNEEKCQLSSRCHLEDIYKKKKNRLYIDNQCTIYTHTDSIYITDK